MSLVLHPQKSFTVVRQIANHTDTSTYYVQAVIRNAYTDAIIETLQLIDRTGQRFSKNWQVPADPSGEGFYVSIVTSVYTDSGYTTKSENYGDEENTYLVQDRILPRGGSGGVDAYTVRRILQEELDKREQPASTPTKENPSQGEPEPMRWGEVLAAVADLKTAMEGMKPEPPEKTDLTPVMTAIGGLKQAIESKDVTPATDLSPVLDRLSEDKEDNNLSREELKSDLAALEETLTTTIKESVQEGINGTEFVSTFSTAAKPRKAQSSQRDEERPIDLKKLAS